MAGGGSRSVRRCSSLIRSVTDFFNTLTEELIIEVLKRLSVKEARRCKCVCKRWFHSISAPYFARCYIRHCSSLKPSLGLFFKDTYKANWEVLVNGFQLATDVGNQPVLNSPGFSLNFLPASSSFQSSQPVLFLASSNGFVLCSTSMVEQKLYYVCNPLTMHWVALPPPPSCYQWVLTGFTCILDFEENGITSRFKVVRIPEIFVEENSPLFRYLRLEIFSSETGEWTDCLISGHKPMFGFDPLGNSAVVCNGMLHWRSACPNHIFAFNPYNEEFRTISLPKECSNKTYDQLFGESQGRLRFAEFHQHTFRVWEIEDYNRGEWSLVHKFHRSEMVCEEDLKLAEYTTWSYLLVILAFHPIEGDIMFLGLPGRILECNLRSRSLKLLCKLAHPAACTPRRIFPHVLPWWPVLVPQR